MKNHLLLCILFFTFLAKVNATFNPVTITAGYNADLVANGSGPAMNSTNAAFDAPNNYAFVATDFMPTSSSPAIPDGFPPSGLINSANTSGLTYQMASLSANNALLLTNANQTGTLSMSTTGNATLYLLVSSVSYTTVTYTATVNFSDGSNQTFSDLSIENWFGGSNYAFNIQTRLARNSETPEFSNDGPRLYERALNLLPANFNKTVTGITIAGNLSGDMNNALAIMGVSANTACSGTPVAANTVCASPSACSGVAFNLSLSTTYTDGGMGYQWEYSNDGAMWVPLANGGTSATANVSQNSATYYHCKVTCLASNQTTTSAPLQITMNQPTACYCIPSYSTGCVNQWGNNYNINSVSITGENNTSINNSNTNCGTNGGSYSDYSATISSVSILPDYGYTLNISTQQDWSNPTFAVWIDLNNDGVFNNTNEKVGTTGSNTGLSVTIQAPSGYTGTHKMRIRAAFFDGEMTDACSMYNNGEAEDYSINILPPPTCITPTTFSSNYAGPGSVQVNWGAVAGTPFYDYVLDQLSTTNPNPDSAISSTVNTNVLFNGLSSGISYYIHVRSHCSSTDTSVWNKYAFSIPLACNATELTLGVPVSGDNTNDPTPVLPASSCGTTSPGWGADGFGKSRWYKFTPSVTGTVSVSTCGSVISGYLRVYSGDCTNLTCVTFADPYSGNCGGNVYNAKVNFYALANTTYYVLFSGATAWTDVGNYTLLAQQTISNDDAVGAIPIVLGAGCTNAIYTNEGATAIAIEPSSNCSGNGNKAPVWFKFIAPSSGAVRISTDYAVSGTLTTSRVGLFSATDSSNYSTFNLIACDKGNGITGDGNLSIIYATDLTSGSTYYVSVDNNQQGNFNNTPTGTFCLSVDELNSTMISTAGVSCDNLQTSQNVGNISNYNGWTSLTDITGKLVANVRNPNGGNPTNFTGQFTINTGAVRQDGSGNPYLNRNYLISNSNITGSLPVDVKLFFSADEMSTLSLAQSSATLGNLAIHKQSGTVCTPNYDVNAGTNAVLNQTGNGSVNGIDYVSFSTPGFSNFFLFESTGSPLGIQLKSIAAKNIGSSNQINWTFAKPENGISFELQRSADGKNYTTIIRLSGKEKNVDYVYYDKTPLSGLNIYKLKLTDINGKSSYSTEVNATMKSGQRFELNAYPNPASKLITIKVSGTENGAVTLTDISGRIISQNQMVGSEMKIDMSKLSNGFYLIHYTDNNLNKVIKINKQ